MPDDMSSCLDIRGHQKAMDILRQAIASGNVHHAWLFSGPEGVGKQMVARAFARALLCARQEWAGCGTCSSCIRFSAGSHSDFIQVMSFEDMVEKRLISKDDLPKDQAGARRASREIRISQIREMARALSMKPSQGKAKVALICDAEKMNVESQNCLLKTLEEPPPGTCMLLVTCGPSVLLPTVRSRCQKLIFNPLPVSEAGQVVAAAASCSAAEAETAARISGGSPGKAIRLLSEGRLAERKEDAKCLVNLARMSWFELFDLSQKISSSHNRAKAFMEFALSLLRDVAVAGMCEQGALVNSDLEEEIGRLAGVFYHTDVLNLSQTMGELLSDLDRNVNVRLTVDRLLIEARAVMMEKRHQETA